MMAETVVLTLRKAVNEARREQGITQFFRIGQLTYI